MSNLESIERQIQEVEKEENDAWGEVLQGKHSGLSYHEVTRLIHKAEALNETRQRLIEFRKKLLR